MTDKAISYTFKWDTLYIIFVIDRMRYYNYNDITHIIFDSSCFWNTSKNIKNLIHYKPFLNKFYPAHLFNKKILSLHLFKNSKQSCFLLSRYLSWSLRNLNVNIYISSKLNGLDYEKYLILRHILYSILEMNYVIRIVCLSYLLIWCSIVFNIYHLINYQKFFNSNTTEFIQTASYIGTLINSNKVENIQINSN